MNDLNASTWDIAFKSFNNLYVSVRERFRCARIVFNAILPRWDDELLYTQSLYYNHKLAQLCSQLHNCFFLDCSPLFSLDIRCFSLDGLHLNFIGKEELGNLITCFVDKKFSPVTTSAYRIPQELKRLAPPKKKSKEWVETDLDEVIYQRKQRAARFKKYRPSPKTHTVVKKPPQKRKPQKKKSSCLEPPPYRQYTPICSQYVVIPYVSVAAQAKLKSAITSTFVDAVPIPVPRSRYVERKEKGRIRKRRRRKLQRLKRRKKVLCENNLFPTVPLIHNSKYFFYIFFYSFQN